MTLTSCPGFLSSWCQKTSVPFKNAPRGAPQACSAVRLPLPWSLKPGRASGPPWRRVLLEPGSRSPSPSLGDGGGSGGSCPPSLPLPFPLWTWHGLDPRGEEPPALTRPWRTWAPPAEAKSLDHRVAWGRSRAPQRTEPPEGRAPDTRACSQPGLPPWAQQIQSPRVWDTPPLTSPALWVSTSQKVGRCG